MKYNLFIGRFAPFHLGHKYIVDSFLNNGKYVCIGIRNSNEQYPLSIRIAMIKSVYIDEIKQGSIKVITIPDIEMVILGRGVGYSIVDAPKDIKIISGTKIRNHNDKDYLPIEVQKIISEYNKKT